KKKKKGKKIELVTYKLRNNTDRVMHVVVKSGAVALVSGDWRIAPRANHNMDVVGNVNEMLLLHWRTEVKNKGEKIKQGELEVHLRDNWKGD
ncbi:hypothetical protein PFISCL1PPCAC_21222, partial [Pristionchus fissidentatus]